MQGVFCHVALLVFLYLFSVLQICDELGVKRPSSVKVFSGKSE